DGQRRPPVNSAKPTSALWSRCQTRSLPTTRAKTLVRRPRRAVPPASVKQSRATASQCRALGIRKNAPAYGVRAAKKGAPGWAAEGARGRPLGPRWRRSRRAGGGRGRRPLRSSGLAGGFVQPKLLEELVQGDAGDAHAEGTVDQVDPVGAAGLGVAEEVLGD